MVFCNVHKHYIHGSMKRSEDYRNVNFANMRIGEGAVDGLPVLLSRETLEIVAIPDHEYKRYFDFYEMDRKNKLGYDSVKAMVIPDRQDKTAYATAKSEYGSIWK